jgi:hypothetical protein
MFCIDNHECNIQGGVRMNSTSRASFAVIMARADALASDGRLHIVVLPVERDDKLAGGLELDAVSLPTSHCAAVRIRAFVGDVAGVRPSAAEIR